MGQTDGWKDTRPFHDACRILCGPRNKPTAAAADAIKISPYRNLASVAYIGPRPISWRSIIVNIADSAAVYYVTSYWLQLARARLSIVC